MWEITGAEFTNQGVHTADGISIRFPRVTRIRDDKDWSTATTLKELRELFGKKPESIDFSLLLGRSGVEDASDDKTSNVSGSSANAGEGSSRLYDEPSTSSAGRNRKMKREPSNVPEESVEKRNDDNHEEGGSADGAANVQSSRKRLKVTERKIKKNTEDLPSARAERTYDRATKRGERRREKRHVDRAAVEGTDAEESFSRETDIRDSEGEDNVSTFDTPSRLRRPLFNFISRNSRLQTSGDGGATLRNVRASLAADFDEARRRDVRTMLRTYPLALLSLLYTDAIIRARYYSGVIALPLRAPFHRVRNFIKARERFHEGRR